MGDGRVSQYQSMLVAQVVAQEARASQANSLVVGIFPSEEGRASQFDAMIPIAAGMDAEVSQLCAMIVGGGRVAQPTIRVATFTLDEHDFYVLFLGRGDTLLYDLYSKRWTNWGSYAQSRWRHRAMVNWPGAVGISPAAQIVAGDDTFGVLYFLDPEYAYDDHQETGPVNAAVFSRIAQGQVVHRGIDPANCFGVSLTGSFGDAALTAVTLSYSDDAGRSYVDAGTLDIDPGDYAARAEWPSLGLVFSPGRLFKIEDEGALARIDSLDMLDEND